MTEAKHALATIPQGLRDPLLREYGSVVQNFMEHRWSPSELSGGHFCEIVYTILEGHAKGKYASKPSKPRDFVGACRALEAHSNVPRSFQILVPRLLPALYEIRNNRGAGHAGGDVDPNHMDAVAVLSMTNWVMAELVRVLHGTSIAEAQRLVDSLAERRVSLVWEGESVKRVLDTTLSLKEQLLLLIGTSPGGVGTAELLEWSGYGKRQYFLRVLRGLHSDRLVEVSKDEAMVQILPPGSLLVESIVARRTADAA